MRRSLKAATVALYSGGMEGVWVAGSQRGGREKKREERLADSTVESANAWCERWEWQRDEREEWR